MAFSEGRAYGRLITNLLELEYPKGLSPIRQPKPSVCPTCQLPYVYNHIAWCRGLTNGYTCRYNLPQPKTPPPTIQSKPTWNPPWKPHCFLCHSHKYIKTNCLWYQCCICHQRAPGHQVINCLELPGKGSALVKKDDYSPKYDVYHNIYEFEDGNLNGENWLYGPKESPSDSISLLINLLSLHLTLHSLSLFINNMPTRPKPKEISMPFTYWLPRGDLHIIIQNVTFCIHWDLFERDSPQFKIWFSNSDGISSQPNKKTLSTAFILDDIQPDEFSNFLWVFYNPTHPLYNTKSHSQWFGILNVTELYTFWSVTKLVFQELSNLTDNMDTDTDQDTNSVVSWTSQSTKYHTASKGALPQPPAPTPKCIPHPDHPDEVDCDRLPYFLTHSTKHWIGFKDKEWSQGPHS